MDDKKLAATEALFFAPNPCIERTFRVPDFTRGHSHRVVPENLRVTAGGKGINAARVARNFGARVRVLAPIGRAQIAQFRQLLEADALDFDGIEVESDTRTTINIVHDGGFTEIVEAGNALSILDGREITNRFGAHLKNCEIVIIGGSYPPSAPDSGWGNHSATLCAMAARAGKRVLYDGKGAAFARAVHSDNPPWAIKPNLDEACELLGRDLETPASQRAAVIELMKSGIEVVLLSCGARGLWLGHESSHVEWLDAPSIEEISPVGSGDSLVGAFVATFLQTGDIIEAARWGVAAGSANAAQLEAARIGRDDAAELFNETYQKCEVGLKPIFQTR